jgi:hypothetical protein
VLFNVNADDLGQQKLRGPRPPPIRVFISNPL